MDEFRFGLKQRLYNWTMRTARERKGWRQADLGNAVGKSSLTISNIECLRIYPNADLAGKIAEILELSQEVLFPLWLREYKLIGIPDTTEEQSISLEEAMAKHLISPQRLLEESVGWEKEIERKIELERAIPAVLEALTPRERRVIEMRFGLRDGQSRTLEGVGREFGLTRTRIQQIEAKALRKLRHPARSRNLKSLLE